MSPIATPMPEPEKQPTELENSITALTRCIDRAEEAALSATQYARGARVHLRIFEDLLAKQKGA